jgi:hypothetical protein
MRRRNAGAREREVRVQGAAPSFRGVKPAPHAHVGALGRCGSRVKTSHRIMMLAYASYTQVWYRVVETKGGQM